MRERRDVLFIVVACARFGNPDGVTRRSLYQIGNPAPL